ncbi:MAG: hypothetical protein NW226_07600 [Microscillaceae bacterium]|nr:hypothetical protein [Microscillaceae bacterium]
MQAEERDKLISELRATIAYAEKLKSETEEELKRILGNYYEEFIRTQQKFLSTKNSGFSGSISLQN